MIDIFTLGRRGGEKGQITSEDYQHEIGKLDETVDETVTGRTTISYYLPVRI